jgi:replicative DNA helicase
MSQLLDDVAEYRLLGAVIDQPEEILKFAPELFTGIRVRLYEAMKATYIKDGCISYEGVRRFYRDPIPQEIDAARGGKISAILDHLIDLATKRQLVMIQEQIAVSLQQPYINREEISRLLQLRPIMTREDSSLTSGISRFVSELQRKKSGQYKFISTGIRFLDHMLGGEWPRQGLTIVMGESGAGKTALVTQSILNMARLGQPTVFISLEMPQHKLIGRLVAQIAQIDGNKLKRGDINAEDQKRADSALEELQSLPIYIVENPEMTVDDIIYTVKTHKETHGIQAFFVDYIQIITQRNVKRDETGSEVLGDLAQKLRNLAVTEDMAAIVLSQQNRVHKGLASILGSGRIGHIADSVFEIKMDVMSTNDDKRNGEISFSKNREGPVGGCQIYYKPKFLQFSE